MSILYAGWCWFMVIYGEVRGKKSDKQCEKCIRLLHAFHYLLLDFFKSIINIALWFYVHDASCYCVFYKCKWSIEYILPCNNEWSFHPFYRLPYLLGALFLVSCSALHVPRLLVPSKCVVTLVRTKFFVAYISTPTCRKRFDTYFPFVTEGL